jgi:hypothetical protein
MTMRNPGLKVIAEIIRVLARNLSNFAVSTEELGDIANELDGIAQRLETTSDLE